ncbi:DNA protecting protein DprA [Candidatus Kaiserbacteria bacterium RIFCSPHIGHO2_02_FULL_55_25]|uniref:DNA protecting protein DprA n=1 Tax=Candidatus Kaiserbacteria bacterium RIFCSPHIGHO2_02_FULL_55_25 TaxID=1798498 RepID=A0A1F6E825_9BACT|nr:MAG: DNA protecting protein DprA [Candidatus Kaiserbacteria bacterium RIFCSPHIGHO2_02_FULL_55_25]OGG77127.1 MAG: DNA protecting protein DprA [Candidatus Kaiserbacteria bacterium RIFCSPHIGHO2_12_FULL_55_13]OGG83381.1 MAG: DNA protecting protein DprA [Candidatus Kaiserbacteria bacterium RIFCSPLOWO2_01_FULL_55_25]
MKDDLKLLAPDEFPALLREIPDRPKQLHLRGTLPSSENKWLAIVGSRACTEYGRRALRYLVEGLRGYPIVIVSGLAYGIDAEAHRAALDTGLTTVAVPGSGLDWNVLYPRANVALAREILEKGGALLSEEKPDMRATDYTFPKRNRVMAGLCHATLMIEAKEKSGSLITAKLTTEYNRDLLVVPGNIFSEESRGTHQFLRLGATAVTSPEDVLVALGITKREGAGTLNELREDLSDDEKRVFEIIMSPRPRDELLTALDLSISEANVLLSTMEIKGLIVEELGVVRIR